MYRARDTKLNRDVALKVLPDLFASDPERLARFTREAQTLASLNHPNIAHIYGIEESGGVRALVMELVEGEDLSQRIARGADPARRSAADREADCRGARSRARAGHHPPRSEAREHQGAARRHGEGAGLRSGEGDGADAARSSPSCRMSPTITTPAMTQAGMILGTAAYMSPEQAKGRPVDKRTDVWAFGSVLYEMLTGRRAFEGDDVSDTLARILMKEPDWTALPATIPPAVVTVLRRCLQKDRKQRVRDIGDVSLALEGAFETAAPQTTAPATSSPPRGRLAWIAAFGVAAAVIVVLAVPTVQHLLETPPVQQSFRFQIAPPPNTRFTTFRLSPDGRYVAYIASEGPTGASRQGRLWIRELASLDSRQIPGSEGSSYPFWSPDSAFIGFFQSGKLRKIAAAGGPAQPICDVADSRGGAWGPDGTILFADGPARPIFRVPSAGGKPAQLTKLTDGDPSEGHRAPEFLPDGEHFLFNATGNNRDNAGIQLGSLDGSAPMRLLTDDANGIFVPGTGAAAGGGYLFFLRAGTLMALPFDAIQRKATAEAFPVAENVASAANVNYGAFSLARNGTLAYWGGVGVANNRELVWMDRSGKRLSVLGKPNAFIFGLALSPDEKTVAATVGVRPQMDIWLLDSASGSMTRFTFGFTGIAPVWTPDGRLIVYARPRAATNDIVRRQISGAAEELLLANIVNAGPTDVSSDGKFIVHDMSVAKTAFDIGLLSTEGDHRESAYLSSPANERGARFSPNGRWMVYQSDESGQYQVYVQTIPTGGGKFLISTSGGTLPAWGHDGKNSTTSLRIRNSWPCR